jgi:hypothetical protein
VRKAALEALQALEVHGAARRARRQRAATAPKLLPLPCSRAHAPYRALPLSLRPSLLPDPCPAGAPLHGRGELLLTAAHGTWRPACRFDDALPFWLFIWAAPLEMLIVLALITQEIGFLPAFTGISTTLALIPAQVRSLLPSPLPPLPRAAPTCSCASAAACSVPRTPIAATAAQTGPPPPIISRRRLWCAT